MSDYQTGSADERAALSGVSQHLGRLEGRVSGLEERQTSFVESRVSGVEERQTRFEMRTDTSLNLILDKVDHLMTSYNQSRGGWKYLVSAGAVVSFTAGVLMWGLSESGYFKGGETARTNAKLDTLIELMVKDRDATE